MRLFIFFFFLSGATAQVKLPPYTKHLLPNGATLLLMQRAELPAIAMHPID